MIYQTVLETSKHICYELVKRWCIAGGEVVTASLVLTSPQNSGQDVGEEMSLQHQKTKQGLGKKK